MPQYHSHAGHQGGRRRRHRGRRARSGRSRRCFARGTGYELRAKIYGLQILKKNVADAKHNTTRFVVLAKKPKWPSRAHKRVVTTFVFQVRNIPAALYKALAALPPTAST